MTRMVDILPAHPNCFSTRLAYVCKQQDLEVAMSLANASLALAKPYAVISAHQRRIREQSAVEVSITMQ